MKDYYVILEGQPQGGFSLEELKYLPITKETFVWHKGLKVWQEASSIPELNHLFTNMPPPVPEIYSSDKPINVNFRKIKPNTSELIRQRRSQSISREIKINFKLLLIAFCMSLFTWVAYAFYERQLFAGWTQTAEENLRQLEKNYNYTSNLIKENPEIIPTDEKVLEFYNKFRQTLKTISSEDSRLINLGEYSEEGFLAHRRAMISSTLGQKGLSESQIKDYLDYHNSKRLRTDVRNRWRSSRDNVFEDNVCIFYWGLLIMSLVFIIGRYFLILVKYIIVNGRVTQSETYKDEA